MGVSGGVVGGSALGTTFTPAGNLEAANVQEALEELDSEKLDSSSFDSSEFITSTGGGKEHVDPTSGFTDVTGSTGAAILSLSDANVFRRQLTGNTTFSVTNATSGVSCVLTLNVKQDGTGGRTITWWSNITWIGATGPPTMTTTAGQEDWFSFITFDGGTNWYGVFWSGRAQTESKEYSISGTIATSTGALRLYNNSGKSRSVTGVRLSAGTAPTGTTSTPITGKSLVLDLNRNGTTMFTTQANRPALDSGSNTAMSVAPDVTAWTDGSYLTLDVDFVGSTVAGSDLVVQVVYAEDS